METTLELSASERAQRIFSFGCYRLIPGRQLLLRDGVPIPLGSRALSLLTTLVQRSGELVTKEELIAATWPDVFVHDSNLKVNMYSLRRSLGDTQKRPTYVATIPGRGYRFVAAVQMSMFDIADPLPMAAAGPNKLPGQSDIIGREREIAELLGLLRTNKHVTIAGAGGVGKTTVAIEAARACEENCADGICFVDLSTVDSPTAVPTVLVDALGIRGNPSDSLAAVLDHLRRRHMLVVLDNCEHILPAASIFAQRLISEQGSSTLLATSREPLATSAENVFWLRPLDCPPDDDGMIAEEALRFPALNLFVRRASEASEYKLIDADCGAIAQICRSLDGLPLAIELAAAKLETNAPQELLAALGEHLNFNNQHNEGVHSRQETLLATIDWSFRLLSPDEAMIFRLVSVFADAFELDDVVDIAIAAGLNPAAVTIGLGGLVAKSLVTAHVRGAGLRYRLLDSTRRYATQRRHEDPIEAQARLCHARRMLTVFEQSDVEWDWRETYDWTRRYRDRLADLRAALAWAFGEGCEPELGIRLTVAAIPLWFEVSLVSEAQAQVELALDAADTFPCDDVLKAKLACARAWNLAYSRKVVPELQEAWIAAIDLAKRSGNVGLILQSVLGLSLYLLETGSIPEAIESLKELGNISSRHRDWSVSPEYERAMALARAYSGHLAESREVFDRLALTYAQPDRRSRMAGFQVDRYIGIRSLLPFVAWMNGHPDYAAATARDAVEKAGSLGHLVSQSNAIAMAALPVSLWNGDLVSLDRYQARLKSIVELENIAIWVPDQQFHEAALRELRGEQHAVDDLRTAIEGIIESGLCSRIGMKLGILADALTRQGRLDEASNALARAFHHQASQGERWCCCELQRIEASILRRGGESARSERLLEVALDEAREIGAVSFELRIASDLASHHLESDRYSDGLALLDPVYRKFSKGFTTKDLTTASQLLHRLNGRLG
ncbi:putative transcriptional regulator [Hyphomicrobium sp. MC1]|nr:putative transcriptional regulator [Hyphomicrobium sp. MC1]